MRKRISSSVFIASLVGITVLILPRHIAAAQLPTCTCSPDLKFIGDPACPCPDIMLTNLTLARLGECVRAGTICQPQSVTKCKVEGTVSEGGTGCSGGFVDQGFTLQHNCPGSPVPTVQAFPCTGLAGHHHLVQLNCNDCT